MIVLAAACSSSSKSSSGTNNTSGGSAATTATGSASGAPGTTVAATGTVIPIGTIESETGSSGGNTTVGTDSIEAWVKWTNAHGGIGGHPVKLFTANDNNDPAQASTAITNMLNNDHIIALVGHDANGTETTWQPILTKAGVPIIGGPPYLPVDLEQANMYSVGTTIESGLYASEYAVHQAGLAKQALIQCNNVAACTSALPLAKVGAKSLGIDLFTTQVSATAPDYTPQCLAAKNFGAQAAELGGINPQTFAQSCAAQSYKPVYVNEYDLFRLSVIKATPEFEGAIGNSQVFPTFPSAQQYPQLSEYFQSMQAYAPQDMQGGSAVRQQLQHCLGRLLGRRVRVR